MLRPSLHAVKIADRTHNLTMSIYNSSFFLELFKFLPFLNHTSVEGLLSHVLSVVLDHESSCIISKFALTLFQTMGNFAEPAPIFSLFEKQLVVIGFRFRILELVTAHLVVQDSC